MVHDFKNFFSFLFPPTGKLPHRRNSGHQVERTCDPRTIALKEWNAAGILIWGISGQISQNLGLL
jgi:hypothetical protein